MRLKYISIWNYRGIQFLENLEVFNMNTFVGKNDSGKSIILRALECFYNTKCFTEKDVYKKTIKDSPTSIQLSFIPPFKIDDLALDSDHMITIKKDFTIKNDKINVDSMYLCYDFLNEKYQNLWNKKEQELNAIITDLGADPQKSGRGKRNVLRIEQIKSLITDNKRKNIYHTLGDFQKNVEKTYEISLPGYSLFDAESDLNVQTTNFQSKFKLIVTNYFNNAADKTKKLEKELKNELSNEFEEIRKYMVKNVSNLKKINTTAEFDWSKALNRFDLNLEFKGEDYDVPISHKGTGFKRLLMVAFFEYIANKKNTQNHIFAIEEPETYLHPSAQNTLLESILQISDTAQFFLTTHSPVFAGASNGEHSILVKKSSKGISTYKRGCVDIIESIIEELGIKPDYNMLKNYDYLIFVEGKDDISFLKIYAKTVLSKTLESDKILCVIGGGASLKNFADLNLFKKLKGDGKYAVIVDGDDCKCGKEKIWEAIKTRCTEDKAYFKKLSKREIENYCHPKAICRLYKYLNINDINIKDDTNVNEYLRNKGFKGNFKNGHNVKVFKAMSKSEWEEMDKENEISLFIKKVYSAVV